MYYTYIYVFHVLKIRISYRCRYVYANVYVDKYYINFVIKKLLLSYTYIVKMRDYQYAKIVQ